MYRDDVVRIGHGGCARKRRLAYIVLLVVGPVLGGRGIAEPVPGFEHRTPQGDAELRAWLENMVWYHGFDRDEIAAATGLAKDAIDGAIDRFQIGTEPRPEKFPKDRLWIVPWPGGRKLTNWGGEVEQTRQRETKATVFAPWDTSSYIVLDVPEAIWSNLGLVYLAHVHVPTVWTEKKRTLEKLEWKQRGDGGLEVARRLPNGIEYRALMIACGQSVRMKVTLHNGTKETLTDLRVQNCVMLKGLKGFQNEDQPQLVASVPYHACGTADGTRWVITAWLPDARLWANPRNPCLHSDPRFEDCPPGESRSIYGWLSFREGKDIDAELKRVDRTGWRLDRWDETPHPVPAGREDMQGRAAPR